MSEAPIPRTPTGGTRSNVNGATNDGRRRSNNNNNNANRPSANLGPGASRNRRSSGPRATGESQRDGRSNGEKRVTTTTTNEQIEATDANARNARPKNSDNYLPHLSLDECLSRYHASSSSQNNDVDDKADQKDLTLPLLVRGKLRVLPGTNKSAFVACDRGLLRQDVVIADAWHRNRALDGDLVYVELLPIMLQDQQQQQQQSQALPKFETMPESLLEEIDSLTQALQNTSTTMDSCNPPADVAHSSTTEDTLLSSWQDDSIQMDLWNPQVTVLRRPDDTRRAVLSDANIASSPPQRQGLVAHVIQPKGVLSELDPTNSSSSNVTDTLLPGRRIVGSLMVLSSGTVLLTPNHRSLPQFKCPQNSTQALIDKIQRETNENGGDGTSILEKMLFSAEYQYGSWKETHKNWPPATNVQFLGEACVLETEIESLLTEYQVDHGEFPTDVLKDVDEAVRSGVYLPPGTVNELGWKPTPEMYVGRRDYRNHRIFTIDPTTAKDLDDALHITELPNGLIEIGVHIADVSFFVRPNTAVDDEAVRRATTVYLVDRSIPMLPRPLCEVACSLNENVERLAFSCVWKMNANGTLRTRNKENGQGQEEDVWYGRTVIKSCARLDYSTAQNIIDNKVSKLGDTESDDTNDELMWPISRRPTGGHTMQQVAGDVRLMHRVAMARRRLRFENGALALNSVKLTFQLDTDGQTPLLAAPYPIRDSNRLVEEYMLLANYLVAQRLITHTGDLACLRHHPPPKMESIDKVVAVAKAGMNFDIDITSSQSLHKSLVRLGQVCQDPLFLNCVTQMLTLPMQQAQYFAAGTQESELWRHFALNMPYYTHFTSPIRRFPDIIVHRLLQASLDGDEAVTNFVWDVKQIQKLCEHSSEKQKGSKEAQQRCDRVYLSLFLRKHPMKSELGIVLSVGRKSFTVYIPSLGADALLYLDEHQDILTFKDEELRNGTRRILLSKKVDATCRLAWNELEIKVFTKLKVSISCKEKPPIDLKLRLEGPYTTAN